MSQLSIITQGLAPGMWAVVSKVVSWEWLESSGRVHWVVETVLPPRVVRSAIPSIISIVPARPDGPSISAPKPSVRRKSTRKQALSVAVPAAS